MSNILKSSESDLSEYALSILEIPERVELLSIVQLIELMKFLDKRESEIVSDICNQIATIDEREHLDPNYHYKYPDKYEPDKLFEYWAERYSQGPLGGYYNTKRLQKIVTLKLNKTDKKEEDKKIIESNPYSYPEIFRKNGYELFKYLKENYTPVSKMKKYGSIYEFMHSDESKPLTISCEVDPFRKFINNNFDKLSRINKPIGKVKRKDEIIESDEKFLVEYFHVIEPFLSRLKIQFEKDIMQAP